MSTDNNDNEVKIEANPIEDFKSEFSKKFSSTEDRISALYDSQQQIINALNNMYPKAGNQKSEESYSEGEDLSSLLLSNPNKAMKLIEERAAAKAKSEIQNDSASKEKRTQILHTLVNKYPELSDTGSELTKLATKIYASYDESDRSSALAYKTAVEDAADQLGIVSSSKRKNGDSKPHDEGYVISGSKGSDNGPKGARKPTKDMLEVAKVMGYDLNDPKQMERITKFLNK